MKIYDERFYEVLRPFESHPLFAPWLGSGEFGEALSTSRSRFPTGRLYFIHQLLLQSCRSTSGEIWEMGVYKGDSATFLLHMAHTNARKLRLFDSFQGMLKVDETKDAHRVGDFADTSLESVKNALSHLEGDVNYHPGWVPETLAGLEDSRLCFAHIDLDLYEPIKAAIEFVWPRLGRGGAVIFDDYGWMSCEGARLAVDEFFASRPEVPMVLPTCQAVVVKLF